MQVHPLQSAFYLVRFPISFAVFERLFLISFCRSFLGRASSGLEHGRITGASFEIILAVLLNSTRNAHFCAGTVADDSAAGLGCCLFGLSLAADGIEPKDSGWRSTASYQLG